jgi:hypothetical protein
MKLSPIDTMEPVANAGTGVIVKEPKIAAAAAATKILIRIVQFLSTAPPGPRLGAVILTIIVESSGPLSPIARVR